MAEPAAGTLQAAIDALRIRDIYLRHSEAYLADGFEPKYDPDADALEVQFQHVVTESSVLEVEDDGAAPGRLFRVFINLGARLVAPAPALARSDPTAATVAATEATANQAQAKPDDPGRVRAAIAAMMVAEYDMISDPGADALTAFALQNASDHVWPYWREFLAAQCVRMNLPKIILAAVQFARRPAPGPGPGPGPWPSQ